MTTPIAELLTLTPDSLIDLYKLDLLPIGSNEQYYFCNFEDVGQQYITFQNQQYIPIPLKAEGFETNSRGQMPSPTIEIGNGFGLITALALLHDDLVGAKFTRRRTFAKYLDSQPTKANNEFTPQVFVVRRKSKETELSITFELKRSIDMGVSTKLPNRLMLKNVCVWTYRSAECGYTGGAVADIYDNPTGDPNQDQCSKSLTGCKYRFGVYGQLPFGGFPGLSNAI